MIRFQYVVFVFMAVALLAASSVHAEPLSEMDTSNLRAAFEVTKASVAKGEAPFGAVIAGPDGTILMVQESVSLSLKNNTMHAESTLASRFNHAFFSDPEFRKSCTLYSSAEPCPMCMTTICVAGIGRVVYGLSAGRLYKAFDQIGHFPRIHLSSHEIVGYMEPTIKVEGPAFEDEGEAIVQDFLDKLMAKKTAMNREKP